jgi:hypothetical protein
MPTWKTCVDVVVLMNIGGTPGVAVQPGVEKSGRVFQQGAFGEGRKVMLTTFLYVSPVQIIPA